MTKEQDNKTYWKEIGLVLIGAMLASIPTLITTHMQGNAQLQQLVLDRRLAALKDFSIISNRAVSEVIPLTETVQQELSEVDSASTFQKKFPQIREDIKLESKRYKEWWTEMNAQTTIINALFDENLAQIGVSGIGPEKISAKDTADITSESSLEIIKDAREQYAERRKLLLEHTDLLQGVVRRLSLKIKKM